MIQKFTDGPRQTRDRLNEMADEINRLTRARGGGVIAHSNMHSGRVTSLLPGQTQSRYGSLLYMNTQSSLITHWPFSSADGDEDIAGQGYDGTFAGNANTDYDVLQLDGTGDYVNLDAHVASLRIINQGTISFWMYPTVWLKVPFSLTHGTGPLADGSFYINYTVAVKRIQIYCHGVLNATMSSGSLAYNRWHHVVYASDATGNAVYIDGAQVAMSYGAGTAATQCFLGDATPDSDDPADTMRIGELYYNSTSYGNFQGAIADFRIYNRGLTHAEIVDLYHTTNKYVIHANEVFGVCRIFEVQHAASGGGDGLYDCYAQTIDAAEWDNTDGTSKLDHHDTTEVEVLNIAETDCEATYVAQLAPGDLLVAWREWDNAGRRRWAGKPFRAGAHGPRMAYCKDDAGGGATITCYLDTDATGTEITVNCNISGGGGLSTAIRNLNDGDGIAVHKIGASWWAIEGFQTIDTAKGLEISGDKLAVAIDTAKGIEFSGGKVAANIDTNKGMEFDGEGELAVTLDTDKGVEFVGGKVAANIDTAKGLEFDGEGELAVNIDTDELSFVAGEITTNLNEC